MRTLFLMTNLPFKKPSLIKRFTFILLLLILKDLMKCQYNLDETLSNGKSQHFFIARITKKTV